MSTLVSGDLLDFKDADFICQQCNCLTISAHGLSSDIFKRFPQSDCYSTRKRLGNRNLAVEESRSKPGTIDIRGHIISMFAQWRPGSINSRFFWAYPEFSLENESFETRAKWFHECLDAIANQLTSDGDSRKTIAFPFQIGCGLAGGDWNRYKAMIDDFATKYKDRFNVLIVARDVDQQKVLKRKKED